MSIYKEWLQTDTPDSPEDIEHYGVLGMKWGVRKSEQEALLAESMRSAAIRKAISRRTDVDVEKRNALLKSEGTRYKKYKKGKKDRIKSRIAYEKGEIAKGNRENIKAKSLVDEKRAEIEREMPGFTKSKEIWVDGTAAAGLFFGVPGVLTAATVASIAATIDSSKYATSEGIVNYVNELLKETE